MMIPSKQGKSDISEKIMLTFSYLFIDLFQHFILPECSS